MSQNLESLVTQVRPDMSHSHSPTISRTDIALQPTSDYAPHAPVLAKDEDETDVETEEPQQPPRQEESKGCWAWFLSCCSCKKAPPRPANEMQNVHDDKHGDDGKREVKLDMSGKSTVSAPVAVPPGAAPQPNAPAPVPANNIAPNPNADNKLPPANAPAPNPFRPNLPPPQQFLLPPLPESEKGRKCLVLDLDETLVHSSFKPVPNADFVINIELEGVIHRVYVLKRPGVDAFMRAVGQKFEVVVFTASLAKYADPLLDILDKHHVVRKRLFREACVHHYGNYVKDLSHLGRKLEHSIIIDNSPFSYMFQPDNAIPISSWFNDKNDRQLYDLLPFLDQLANVDDVCALLSRRKAMTLAQQQGGAV